MDLSRRHEILDDWDRMVLEEALERRQASIKDLADRASRSGHLVNLGVASLGGTIAIGGLLSERGVEVGLILFSFGSTAVATLAIALLFLVSTLVGFDRKDLAATGPDLDSLLDQFEAMDEDPRPFFNAYLRSLAAAEAENRGTTRRLGKRQGRGVALLAIGLISLACAVAYVVGGSIID